MIRLLQNFSGMSLDLTAQPPDARPPPEWRECAGRKGLEQVRPKSHFTLYAEVSGIGRTGRCALRDADVWARVFRVGCG